MAPGVAGNVYALDLRFEGDALVCDLDEVRPTQKAGADLIQIRWDTVSTSTTSCLLLDGVAHVELPLGYRRLPRQNGVPVKTADDGYIWDHVREGHASALILVFPTGFTFSRDLAPPISCDATGPTRLSAKEYENRIAILFVVEPDSWIVNLRTSWHMARLTGSLSTEIRRINGMPKLARLPEHMAVDPPVEAGQQLHQHITADVKSFESRPSESRNLKSPWHKRRLVKAAAVAFCFIALGWFFYRRYCPPVKVPNSHFVKVGENRRVVLFVHGVMGDMDNTWASGDGRTSWPGLLARDPELADYDVYVYGYQSPCSGDSSNITEIATRFGRQLQDENFFSKYQELYFITHSMGGLITKKMLSSLNTYSESDKLQHVRGVVFIAVPTGGADIASIAAWLSTNPQFRNMDPHASQAFLQSIEQDWASMIRNRTSERPFPRAFVAYETRDIAGLKIVPALFTSQISDLTPMPFDYDHIQIVKPDSPDNDVYKWTKKRILESSDYLTSSDNDAIISVVPPDNPTLAKMVDFISRQTHVAITFAGCTNSQLNTKIQVNGAQLSGKGVPGFFENAVRPRISVYFTVTTKQQDVSYEIVCRVPSRVGTLLRRHNSVSTNQRFPPVIYSEQSAIDSVH